MTVREIVAAHLKEIGAEGLISSFANSYQCKCSIDNLMKCMNAGPSCRPAYFRDGKWTTEPPMKENPMSNEVAIFEDNARLRRELTEATHELSLLRAEREAARVTCEGCPTNQEQELKVRDEAMKMLTDYRVAGLCIETVPCHYETFGDCVPCLIDAALKKARERLEVGSDGPKL